MAYIGNAKTPLLLATNVRDDLIPGLDGTEPKNTFDLSQEVPGGEERNVTVVRRRYLSDSLVKNSTQVAIDGNKVIVTDDILAAALSVIQPRTSNYEGDILKLEYDTAPPSQDPLTVIDVTYTRDSIEITLHKSTNTTIAEGAKAITLSRHYYGAWEILDPETDYRILGEFGTPSYHKQIRLTLAPQLSDIVYVLHRGDATYNFVPSPKSVGVDQLSDNLRTFKCDRHTGDATITEFSLSQNVASERSILVTVNGLVQEGEDNEANIVGDWSLIQNTQTNTQSIKFRQPPATGAKIRILHLGFVSNIRRAAFAPGQTTALIEDGSVTNDKIADNAVNTIKLADTSITTTKLRNDSVTSEKILLHHQTSQSLRMVFPEGTKNLLTASNTLTEVFTKDKLAVNFNDQSTLTLSSSIVEPSVTNAISLGSQSKKLKDLYLEGSANINTKLTVGSQGADIQGPATITGATSINSSASIQGALSTNSTLTVASTAQIDDNLTVDGNIILVHPSPTDKRTVDGVVVSKLYEDFQALAQKVSTLIPVGTIMLSGKQSPQTTDGVWLVCDGSQKSKTEYPELFAAIEYAFGGAGDTFNVPDLRRRVPVGKSSSDSLGSTEGSEVADRLLSHNHTGAPHTHDLSDHTHSIPGHKHTITADSTLAITTNSGTHTTDLKHDHNPAYTEGPISMSNTSETTLSHKHDNTHSHTGTATDGGKDHTHIATVAPGGGKHSHKHRGKIEDSGTFPVGAKFRVTGSASSNTSTTDAVLDDTDSEHSHTINVTGARNPSNTSQGWFLHTHPLQINNFAGSTGEPSADSNNLVHRHKIDLVEYTGTVTGGEHKHESSSFSGFIGNDGSVEGNVSSETFISGTPSTNLTSGAAYSGPTGNTTTPHIILNFVIKAKNS